ncbi:hypothetical protein IHQ68_18595 [Chelatococcus sambhunathii]|uniref:Uncharacterized protein n=1 Tax=Chelatococcus sambhunathii TaxID=363953 RepID=A0ABU1DKL4_9HYPH|nr:hypothetical protein [Chelatococcus sambhunathii]
MVRDVPAARRTGDVAVRQAAGAFGALGLLAIGAAAIGAVAIGRLSVRRAHIGSLKVDRLIIGAVRRGDGEA